MAPLLGVLILGVLLVVVVLMFLSVGIGGLFCLWKGSKHKSRSLKITGGVLLIADVAIAIFFLGPMLPILPKSLNDQAAEIMDLPPEAKVVQVTLGDWAGDGEVQFKLPASHSVNTWLDIIWKMNLPDDDELKASGASTGSRTNDRSITYAGNYLDLSYNPATHFYLYRAVWNS
jgi:hypothetical protein